MHRMLPILLVACGGSTPPAGEPTKPSVAASPEPASPPIDAASAPPTPVDAGPPAELAAAPAWIFRYDAPPRVETWTLRHHDGLALVEVTTAQGTTRYLGTAADGASLALEVSTATTTMKLDCRPASRAIGPRCNDAKAKPIAVLDCYHPDFAAPMTFAAAPGVEFDASCGGYRTLP